MSARAARRNNVLAGSFLILSLTLAVVLSFWVSNVTERLGRFTPYVVSFSLRDGASGLKKGSPVMLGGQNVGRVVDVVWATSTEASDGRGIPDSLDVHVKVDSKIPLYDNAMVNIERPILGGLASINIVDPGGAVRKPRTLVPSPFDLEVPLQTFDNPKLLAAGERMMGGLAPGLLAQAGFGPEELAVIKSMMRKADQVASEVNTITAALAEHADATAGDAAKLIAAANETMQRVKGDYTESWSPKVEEVLGKVNRSADNVERISGQGVTFMDNASAGLDEARGVVRTVQTAIDDNRADVDSIIDKVNETTKFFRENTLEQISGALDTYTETAQTWKDLGVNANVMLSEQRPNVRETLENVRLATLDARLLVSEVRAQPWRIMKPPNTKESERQVLYAAARAYASSVSDLKSASESLDSVLQLAEATRGAEVNPLEIGELQQRLKGAFERYQRAEQDLLDVIVQFAPGE